MKLWMRTVLSILMLLQVACVNTMQAYIDKNLPALKPYPLKESLLAAVFTEYSSTQHREVDGKVIEQTEFFPKSEEEIAQKAMNKKSGYVTTWNNAQYGELKFRTGNTERKCLSQSFIKTPGTSGC